MKHYCYCHGYQPKPCPTPVRRTLCGALSKLGWAIIKLSTVIGRTTH